MPFPWLLLARLRMNHRELGVGRAPHADPPWGAQVRVSPPASGPRLGWHRGLWSELWAGEAALHPGLRPESFQKGPCPRPHCTQPCLRSEDLRVEGPMWPSRPEL